MCVMVECMGEYAVITALKPCALIPSIDVTNEITLSHVMNVLFFMMSPLFGRDVRSHGVYLLVSHLNCDWILEN